MKQKILTLAYFQVDNSIGVLRRNNPWKWYNNVSRSTRWRFESYTLRNAAYTVSVDLTNKSSLAIFIRPV